MAPPRGTDNGVAELKVVDKPRIRPSLVTFGSLVSGGLTKRMANIYIYIYKQGISAQAGTKCIDVEIMSFLVVSCVLSNADAIDCVFFRQKNTAS